MAFGYENNPPLSSELLSLVPEEKGKYKAGSDICEPSVFSVTFDLLPGSKSLTLV